MTALMGLIANKSKSRRQLYIAWASALVLTGIFFTGYFFVYQNSGFPWFYILLPPTTMLMGIFILYALYRNRLTSPPPPTHKIYDFTHISRDTVEKWIGNGSKAAKARPLNSNYRHAGTGLTFLMTGIIVLTLLGIYIWSEVQIKGAAAWLQYHLEIVIFVPSVIMLIGYTLWFLPALKHPRPYIYVDSFRIPLGGEFGFYWFLKGGNTNRFREFTITLEAYTMDTTFYRVPQSKGRSDYYTDVKKIPVVQVNILKCESGRIERRGACIITLPDDNELVERHKDLNWALKVHGTAFRGLDLEVIFPFSFQLPETT